MRYEQPTLNRPKNTASHNRPLIRKNIKPATPRRRNHIFQFFFSMFRASFSRLSGSDAVEFMLVADIYMTIDPFSAENTAKVCFIYKK